jgi:DNA-binding NtrC family response regulator
VATPILAVRADEHVLRLEEALRAEQGNRAAAARRLGVSKQWLHRLLSRWGRDAFEPAARSVG